MSAKQQQHFEGSSWVVNHYSQPSFAVCWKRKERIRRLCFVVLGVCVYQSARGGGEGGTQWCGESKSNGAVVAVKAVAERRENESVFGDSL